MTDPDYRKPAGHAPAASEKQKTIAERFEEARAAVRQQPIQYAGVRYIVHIETHPSGSGFVAEVQAFKRVSWFWQAERWALSYSELLSSGGGIVWHRPDGGEPRTSYDVLSIARARARDAPEDEEDD